MGNFPKIREQQTKSKLAAEALQAVILSRYGTGDKLPPERLLAQEMNISRATLREAIGALQIMGIIEVRQSQGHFVAQLPKKTKTLFSLENIFIPGVNPLTMVDARIAFEPGTAYLAAQRASGEDIARLEAVMKDIESSLRRGSMDAYSLADVQFHADIAKCAQNEIVEHFIGSLLDVRKTPLWQAMKAALNTGENNLVRMREHRAILEAIGNGKSEDAAKCMREHLERSKERFLSEVEEEQE